MQTKPAQGLGVIYFRVCVSSETSPGSRDQILRFFFLQTKPAQGLGVIYFRVRVSSETSPRDQILRFLFADEASSGFRCHIF